MSKKKRGEEPRGASSGRGGGETPEEAWPNLASLSIHSHLKDWKQTPDGKRFTAELVGRGIIKYPKVLAMMKASGYSGALSFEYEGPMNRADAAREGIAYLRSVLESL